MNPSVVVCKVCRKDVAYSSNTTNLRQHLESSHRELLPSTYSSNTTNLWQHLESSHRELLPSTSAHEGSIKQVTLKETLSSTKKLASDSAHAVVVMKSLAEFIAKDMQPITTVEGAGFCHFMSVVEPHYVVPSRKHISGVLRCLYDEVKERVVVGELDTATVVTLTTDFWTSAATDSYLGITAHFITASWQLESRVLQTHELAKQHTGKSALCIC